jgi:NAD+ synthase
MEAVTVAEEAVVEEAPVMEAVAVPEAVVEEAPVMEAVAALEAVVEEAPAMEAVTVTEEAAVEEAPAMEAAAEQGVVEEERLVEVLELEAAPEPAPAVHSELLEEEPAAVEAVAAAGEVPEARPAGGNGWFTGEVLRIDPAATAAQLEAAIRDQVFQQLRRHGAVVELTGGVDSSVVAALCVRALGRDRVLGLFLPERDSSEEGLRLGRSLAEMLGIQTHLEDVSPILDSAGYYRRREEALQTTLPELVNTPGRALVTSDAYLRVVAASNFKQRTREMIQYYWADRLHFAVAGTPSLLEYSQGFLVKNRDGAADVKPITHLYKSQVYQLAEYLGIPEEIRQHRLAPVVVALEQAQEAPFLSASQDQMDLCQWAFEHGVPAKEAAAVAGLTTAEAERAYQWIEAQRSASRYPQEAPLLAR